MPSLASVRFLGGALPALGTANISRLVDLASIRPASRKVKYKVRPSGENVSSSPPPNGLDGVSPTSLPSTGTPAPASFPPATGKVNRRERTPGVTHVSQWRTNN